MSSAKHQSATYRKATGKDFLILLVLPILSAMATSIFAVTLLSMMQSLSLPPLNFELWCLMIFCMIFLPGAFYIFQSRMEKADKIVAVIVYSIYGLPLGVLNTALVFYITFVAAAAFNGSYP